MSSRLQRSKKPVIFQLLFAIIFFTSGIITNLVQCVLYVCIRSWNKRLYRKINSYLCSTIYGQIVFIGDWWSGIDLIIYADKDEFDTYCGKEHAYCVVNHSFEIDWLVVMMLADRMHLLGNAKAYVKKALQFAPVLGWAWKLSDFIFLERSFEKDKKVIGTQIKELASYPDPMWLALYPEGTRFTPSKHKASEEFARERNLQGFKYHLQPRTRGFITSLGAMKGKIPAMYDMTIAFQKDDSVKPTMSNLIMGKTTTAHLYIKRIPLEKIPESEIQQEQFLRDIFLQKDKMRDSFETTGDFFTTSEVQRVTPFRVNRRKHLVVNMILWGIVILCPLIYYLVKLLLSGQLLYLSIGLGVIFLFMVLLYKTVGMSQASKGSTYGTVRTSHKTNVV